MKKLLVVAALFVASMSATVSAKDVKLPVRRLYYNNNDYYNNFRWNYHKYNYNNLQWWMWM